VTRRNVELKAHTSPTCRTARRQDEADRYAQLGRLQQEFGIEAEAVIGASYSDLLQQAD